MKEALLIVDLQKDFCPGGALAVQDGDKIVPVINKLMKNFDIVIATKDWHSPNSKHFDKWPVHCLQESEGSEFHNELNSDKISKIFYKGTSFEDDGYSGFEATNEDLESHLRKQNINKLYICGLALDYCVKATALDAAEKGFDTYIVLDACKSVTNNKKEIDDILNEFENKGIKIVNSKNII